VFRTYTPRVIIFSVINYYRSYYNNDLDTIRTNRSLVRGIVLRRPHTASSVGKHISLTNPPRFTFPSLFSCFPSAADRIPDTYQLLQFSQVVTPAHPGYLYHNIYCNRYLYGSRFVRPQTPLLAIINIIIVPIYTRLSAMTAHVYIILVYYYNVDDRFRCVLVSNCLHEGPASTCVGDDESLRAR